MRRERKVFRCSRTARIRRGRTQYAVCGAFLPILRHWQGVCRILRPCSSLRAAEPSPVPNTWPGSRRPGPLGCVHCERSPRYRVLLVIAEAVCGAQRLLGRAASAGDRPSPLTALSAPRNEDWCLTKASLCRHTKDKKYAPAPRTGARRGCHPGASLAFPQFHCVVPARGRMPDRGGNEQHGKPKAVDAADALGPYRKRCLVRVRHSHGHGRCSSHRRPPRAE